MNIHFSYKNTVKSPQVDKIIDRHVQKLNKWLSTFNPDLVHLHAGLEFQNPRQGFVTSLNLRLPVGQLYAAEAGRTAQDAMRAAFDELERQIQKQMNVLRQGKTRSTLEETGATERLPRRARNKRRRPQLNLT